MNAPLIEGQEPDIKTIADRYRLMAAKIELNGTESFGGAFVVTPPKGAGDPIETLILDNQQDPLQFWKLLMEKAKDMVTDLEIQARMQQGFQQRR